MKSIQLKHSMRATISALLCCITLASAQPAASPLTIQGLDQFTVTGVRARAMGGAAVANANDATALFSNPAALSRITALEIRAGGIFGNTRREQTQQWTPFRTLPGLSVLFESLTGTVKKPDSNGVTGQQLSPWTTLQKQYDNITPAWDKKTSQGQPLSFAAAMPVTVSDIEMTAGIGIAQTISLDHYYQNNNSMTPYLGQQRPDPMLITSRTDTLHVKWYQYQRTREGSVYGITPGISVSLLPGLKVGGSATVLTGSSDDKEQRVERGHINIAIGNGEGQNFMVDTVYFRQTKTGTSKYSGTIFTGGMYYQAERYSIGVTVKPSMKITRDWNRSVVSIDTTKKSFPVRIDSLSSRTASESGKDFLEYPLAYSIGLVLMPTTKWTIAFDYEMRSLSEAKYTSSGSIARPWTNAVASIRVGAEYRTSDALAIRGGYRDDNQAFSPDGSAILDEPARGSVYSLGTGFTLENITIEAAYEYSILKYHDMYQSNVNYNTREMHQIVLEAAYRF